MLFWYNKHYKRWFDEDDYKRILTPLEVKEIRRKIRKKEVLKVMHSNAQTFGEVIMYIDFSDISLITKDSVYSRRVYSNGSPSSCSFYRYKSDFLNFDECEDKISCDLRNCSSLINEISTLFRYDEKEERELALKHLRENMTEEQLLFSDLNGYFDGFLNN